MIRPTLAILLAAGVLAACDRGPEETPPAGPPAALTPAGDPTTVEVDEATWLQAAATVVQLHAIEDQNAKVFGTAQGDPAVNGLYTFVAFFESTAEGWRVFRIGDFESFEVLGVAPGRIDLEIRESAVDGDSGQIVGAERRLIVGWTPGADGAPPQTITVTPAADPTEASPPAAE